MCNSKQKNYRFARVRIIWHIFRFLMIIIIGLEVFLQFYNPFSTRIKHNKVLMPKNVVYEINQNQTNAIDSHIFHSKNSLGFRGDELPETKSKKIICMGGSTTECFYLSDGKDWPALLKNKLFAKNKNIWLNNAGMDGHSTRGHLELLNSQILKLKPDMIFLMCGLNDISLDTNNRFENKKISFWRKLYNQFEIPATIVNLKRVELAVQSGFNHQIVSDFGAMETIDFSDSEIKKSILEEKPFVKGYEKRLTEIIKICKKNKIKLVLITQSILFENTIDVFTDVYFGNKKTGNKNGNWMGKLLDLYNNKTLAVGKKRGVYVIDLNQRMPQDSRFFYDGYHFSNNGADMVADIIFDESKQLFK